MSRITGFAILMLAAMAWASAEAVAAADKDNYVEPDTGLSFPRKVGTLARTNENKFPNPELGVAVRYEGADLLKCDVFVYRGGVRDLSGGVESAAVKAQFERLKKDVQEAERRGYYKDVKIGKDGTTKLTTPAGEITLLRTSFRYSETERAPALSQRPRISHAFLTVYQGRFLKIRFSYLESKKTEGDKALADFLKGIAEIFPEK